MCVIHCGKDQSADLELQEIDKKVSSERKQVKQSEEILHNFCREWDLLVIFFLVLVLASDIFVLLKLVPLFPVLYMCTVVYKYIE